MIKPHVCCGYVYTVEHLLRGHPDQRPNLLQRPLDNINLNKNFISTSEERPTLLRGHISNTKGVSSQEVFH